MESANYPIFGPENSDLLRRMQETPSQIQGLSIFESWQQQPEDFDKNRHLYAGQLGVGPLDLLLKTLDYGPLERAMKKCTLLPVTAEMFRRKMPELLEMTAKYLKPIH